SPSLLLTRPRPHHHPHPFPTRRSSDLACNSTSNCAHCFANSSLPRIDNFDGAAAGLVGAAGLATTIEAGGGVAPDRKAATVATRSEEHTSELQSRENLVCRLLLEKKTD